MTTFALVTLHVWMSLLTVPVPLEARLRVRATVMVLQVFLLACVHACIRACACIRVQLASTSIPPSQVGPRRFVLPSFREETLVGGT